MLAHRIQAAAVGTPAQIKDGISSFVDLTQADEIIVCGATYDPEARVRSLDLTMQAVNG